MATSITIILHTGTNLGDLVGNLDKANALIEAYIGSIVSESRMYVTQAWGNTKQSDFLNQALIVQTKKSPEEILDAIGTIERIMGRIRKVKWGERIIDIDIIFYGNEVIETPQLSIPHPHLQERNFVLQPLLELIPDFIHPVFNQTIKELVEQSKDKLEVAVL